MSTAMFRPLMLTYAEMANLSVSEGRFLMTTDTHEMYLDVNNNSRIKITSESGEIPIGAVNNIQVISENGQVTIKWTDPDDLIAAGVTYSSWAGTKLVIKESSYPISPKDGILVTDNKIKNQYSINGYNVTNLINGIIYYGRLFPYSTNGYINVSDENKFILNSNLYSI